MEAPLGSVGQFLTRWSSHLCAPTFVFLAGAAIALSMERRLARGESSRQLDRHLFTRGLFLMLLDPTWMSFGFQVFMLQVMYAIGLSMICMVFLRRISSPILIASALIWILGNEFLIDALDLVPHWPADPSQWAPPQTPILFALSIAPGVYPFMGSPWGALLFYPLLTWLAVMMLGWTFGRSLLARIDRDPDFHHTERRLWQAGFSGLALFLIVRALDGYGNGFMPPLDGSGLRWLQISKYPPSLAFLSVQLGLMAIGLALAFRLQRTRAALWTNSPLLVFGQASLFFYVLHIHLMMGFAIWIAGGPKTFGLASAWLGGAAVLILLYPACRWFRSYRAAHPHGWARFF